MTASFVGGLKDGSVDAARSCQYYHQRLLAS
jgi:hypothetical protein